MAGTRHLLAATTDARPGPRCYNHHMPNPLIPRVPVIPGGMCKAPLCARARRRRPAHRRQGGAPGVLLPNGGIGRTRGATRDNAMLDVPVSAPAGPAGALNALAAPDPGGWDGALVA